MVEDLEYLAADGPMGPFPFHRIKRVAKTTNLITDDVQRIDYREIAYAKANRGDYGPAVQKAMSKSLPGKYPVSAAQKDAIMHLTTLKTNEVAGAKAPISHEPHILTRHIKRLAYFLKADAVGVCRLPLSGVYSHDGKGNPINIHYENAIVFLMRKELETMEASSGFDWAGDPLSFQCYQRLGLVAETLANYIRRLGYPASPEYGPSFTLKYHVLIPPLVLHAGLGEASRAGIILNPFLGLAFKGAAVLTDMPLVPDKPIDFGLQDFCRRCQICAEMCPSKAIRTGEKIMYNGYQTWKLDTQRCASFNFRNSNGTMCNRCVKVCPWSHPSTWQHNLVRWAARNSGLARSIAIKGSRLLGPGKEHKEKKWWFDLEDVDGVLKVPDGSQEQ